MYSEKTCCCCSVGGSLVSKPWIPFGLGLLVMLFAVACASGPASDAQSDEGAESATPLAYTVRGKLLSLPGADETSSRLRIQHEAIPDFVGHDGKVSGMDAMTMSFATQDGLPLDGLAVGDKIEFDFDLDWDRNPSLLVTGIRSLDAETELTLASDH